MLIRKHPDFRPAPVELGARDHRIGWSTLRPLLVGAVLLCLAAAVTSSASRMEAFKRGSTAVQVRVAEGIDASRAAWDKHLRTARVAEALDNLRIEHARLGLELQRLRAVEAEHERLLSLLEVERAAALDGVGARVVARPGGGGRQTLRLDGGTERGIAPGMAVLSPDGVVGQVISAGEGYSDVLALTDPSHGLAGVLEEGRNHGTLRGTGRGLALDHVLTRLPVAVGERVLTSGEGGVFPPDWPVGEVVSVGPDAASPFLAIEIAPFAAPELLDEVLVVRGLAPAPELAVR